METMLHPDALDARRTQLQQALTQRRQQLAQLDAQRMQLHATIWRLEGGIAALTELLTTHQEPPCVSISPPA
jgi:cell division protein FtsB